MFTTLLIPIAYSKTKIDKNHLCHCLERNLFVLLTKRFSLVTLTKLIVDKNNTMISPVIYYVDITYEKVIWLSENLVVLKQFLGSSCKKTFPTPSLLLMFHFLTPS